MKILKRILIFFCALIILGYLGLYLVLPYFLNKKDYSKTVTDIIKKETGLVILVHNYKLDVSPALNINFKADVIQGFYPDNKQFLNIKKSDITISTLYLLKKEIKLNKAKAEELQFSTKLLKNGKTTIQEYIEANVKQSPSGYIVSKNHPVIYIKSYIIKLKDEESGQKFKLKGNDLKARRSVDFQNINIETNGDLYCFDKKYLHYNAKVSVPQVLLENTDKMLFDFTVDDLYRYDFSANVTTDLKIHAKDKKIDYISGKTDIDNFKLKLGSKILPPSFFHIVFGKDNAQITSKFYTGAKEVTDINANIKLTKPYKINMLCKCPQADIANLHKTIIPVLNLFKIKNNLSGFNAQGKLSADFKLQTDLKTISSNGSLKIKNASITHKSIPLKITNVNALIDFSDNSINIKQSDMLVNNQPLKAKGTIDKNANADIIVSADNLDFNHIINAFPQLKPKKSINVISGKVSFNAHLNGRLNKIASKIQISIKNFAAVENIKNIKISLKDILINASNCKGKYAGDVVLKNVVCSSLLIPNNTNSIKSDSIQAKITEEKIHIFPVKINAENAKLTLSGDINNYLTSPESTVLIQGTIDTALLKSFGSKNLQILYKGYLPVKILVKSANETTNFNIKILANQNNYITPMLVKSFDGITTLTDLEGMYKNDEILINNATMYYAGNTNSLLKDVDTSKLKKVITIKGKVKNLADSPVMEKILITTSSALSVSIPQTNDGIVNITANLTANGSLYSPTINGVIKLSDLSIPSMFVKAQNADINLAANKINLKLDNLKINDMDVSVEADAEPDIIKTNKINYLRLSSSYIDMNYLMKIMSMLNPSKYAPGNDFPYVISSGNIDIKSFNMGMIKANNVTAEISSQKNNLYINKMFSDAYGGKVAGKISYNFPYTNIHADIQGRGLNAATAAATFMPADKGISGILDFDASVNMIGTEQSQQLNTLKGNADVLIRNGRLGQLGRFEHFLYAQNLLSQKLIYASLNSAKQAISPQDTGLISYLKGKIKFSAGYAHINPVLTSGPQMSMFVKGKINLINQHVDLKILGKISPNVSSSLGLLGSMTIKDFLDEHTKYGSVVANLFNSYNIELPEVDISKIPPLTPDYKTQTKNFQVIISGNPESVSSVRSFTWVNPPGTKEKILTEKVKKAINEALPDKTPQDNSGNLPKLQPQTQTAPALTTPDFLDKIPDDFKN